MENFQVIEFHKRRDFSEKVNITFHFVKQNFRSFMKAIILIAGPPVLIASLLLSSFMGELFKLTSGIATNPEGFSDYFTSTNFWLEMGLMFIFMMVGYVAIIATTNNYVILYGEKKSNSIEVSEVWTRVRETLGMYTVTMILMAVLSIAVYALMIIPVAILATVSPFLIFFLVVFLLCFILYLAIGISLVFVVRGFEKVGFFPSILRSFYLIRGKWWSTFGLIMIFSIIIGVASYIFSIPASVIQTVTALHNVDTDVPANEGSTTTIVFVLNSLAYICQLLLYFFVCISLIFQYFNLVELKESKGLMGQIGTIGQPPPPRTDPGQY